MELKEGKHIRTKDGFLHTILGISEQTGRPYHTDKTNLGNYIELDNISKCVDSIDELIEDGDYVNGMEVMDADWFNEEGDYEEGLAFPMYASDDLDIIENWLPLRSVPIKSIVTKEQFESMSYKVN